MSVITSAPSTKSTPDAKSGTNSIAGHTAILVDGTVFSFEGDGKWHTYSKSDYMTNEKQVRTVIAQTLNVDQSNVEMALNNRTNGTYNVETNSCVTQTMSILEAGGIQFSKPNGVVSPEQLSVAISNSSLQTYGLRYNSLSQSSMLGATIYKIANLLGINPTGKTLNTKPLIQITK